MPTAIYSGQRRNAPALVRETFLSIVVADPP
jgi:hypothetical protein